MKPRLATVQLLALVVLVAGCQAQATPLPTPTRSAHVLDPPGGAEMEHMSALGTIRPAQTLQLSFGASGPVHAVMAHLGMEVVEGALLAELDTAAMELEEQSARQEVALRQAQLEGVTNGPGAALVERAEDEQARQVAQAELALRMAEANLSQGQQEDAAALAEAEITAEEIRLRLEQAWAKDINSAVTIAFVKLGEATATLADAQEAYDHAWDSARDWEMYMTDPVPVYPGSLAMGPSLSKQLENDRKSTELNLASARAGLEIAQAEYNQALSIRDSHSYDVQSLQQNLALAEFRARRSDGNVLGAQAAYSLTLELLAAEAELAQLQLDGLLEWENPLLDPAPPEEVAQARARLRQAELAVARLELQMQGAELRAPFDGVVSAIYLRPGEWCAAGVPAVELVDTTGWLVETRNVGELNIGRVRVGAEAIVRVNAFRGEELRGKVVAISPIAVVQQGDTTYTLTIELEHTDLNLRPGMNAQVELTLE